MDTYTCEICLEEGIEHERMVRVTISTLEGVVLDDQDRRARGRLALLENRRNHRGLPS